MYYSSSRKPVALLLAIHALEVLRSTSPLFSKSTKANITLFWSTVTSRRLRVNAMEEGLRLSRTSTAKIFLCKSVRSSLNICHHNYDTVKFGLKHT